MFAEVTGDDADLQLSLGLAGGLMARRRLQQWGFEAIGEAEVFVKQRLRRNLSAVAEAKKKVLMRVGHVRPDLESPAITDRRFC